MTTAEVIGQLRNTLLNRPEIVTQIPAEDIAAAVYTELYGLRQLYPEKQFEEIEALINTQAETLYAAKDARNHIGAVRALQSLGDVIRYLPDNESAQDFIEEANFNRAICRHLKSHTTIVLGDSHTGFFSGHETLSFIPVGNGINTCDQINGLDLTVLHLGPCLAYHCMQRGTTNAAPEKTEYLMERFITPGARVITVMGEIDIRAHVFRETQRQGRTYQSVLDEITEQYFSFIMFLKKKGYQVACFGPVASQKDKVPIEEAYPRIGSETDRNRATQYFTDRMRDFCGKEDVTFVSVFDRMITEDYRTIDTMLSDDGVHLGQAALPLVKERFQANGFIL